MHKSKIALLSVTLLASGCASIISDSSFPLTIKSVPDQADFVVTNQKGEKIHSGKTPSTVTLNSGAGYFDGEKYQINLTKDGYKEQDTTVDTYINGWYFGNFAFGGLLGFLVIDPLTGAMWRLPESTSTTLVKK